MRKLLIVIDMQNDFIDGALGTKEAQGIVSAVKAKIESYPIEDVFYTVDTHGADYLKTQEGRNLPVEHCIKGTKGWKIATELEELLAGAKRHEKPTFGSVSLSDDISRIAEGEDISIEMVGLCTDICVVSNALLLKAVVPEVEISVDAKCCAGVTPESHKAVLATMRACQIKILE